MGLITDVFQFVFGGGRNVIVETREAFRPNAEADAQRGLEMRQEAMTQFSKEFGQPGIINNIADGLNRLGRPVITYGVIALFCSALWDPVWFAARMQSLVLVPEPLWIIFGAIVSFFFGARELSKFRTTSLVKEAARIADAVPQVVQTVKEINALAPGTADTGETIELSENAAVNDWQRRQ